MTDIINLLPDALANQIAAGEVVQRPASVVKELLENAVDAGGTHIQLIIKDAGKSLIQVVDDGIGMSETDARMSFERHATSKITQSEDLYNIRTMGFRGEALASISAVAQVEMKSKLHKDEFGTVISIEGSALKSQESTACSSGTSISVKNLFFNVPARRNFLKSNPVELRHIMDEFQRIALANPQISFTCFQNDLEVYRIKNGNLGQRIVQLFGKSYQRQLVPCEENIEEIKIKGYVGKPEQAKKGRGEQFFFVNNRFIKSNYLNHAVFNAYHQLIPEDYFPFFTLFIEIDPIHVDVNVHPTKTEIKFDDEKTIYSIIKSCVKKSLGIHNLTPSMDYSVDTNFLKDMSSQKLKQDSFKNPDKFTSERNISNKANWEELYLSAFEAERFEVEAQKELDLTEESQSIRIESDANRLSTNDSNDNTTIRQVIQIQGVFIATPVKSGIMFIHQSRAHERILFEKFEHNIKSQKGVVQQFLFPETIELNPSDKSIVRELEQEIKALGFRFEDFGKNAIALQGSPATIGTQNGKQLFLSLIENYKNHEAEFSKDKTTNTARFMAKNSAIKEGTKISSDEMLSLIDQLFGCSNPNHSPSGEKIYIIQEKSDLELLFNKR